MLGINIKSKNYDLIWIFFLVFVILQAFITFINFSSEYFDADQLVTADHAKWMSKGLFFHGHFYGQDYMFPIDSYLSAAIIKLGLNPLTAVQICNIFFFYLPFLYLSKIINRNYIFFRFAFILIIIFLPFKFILISHMARTFTTASSIACLAAGLSLFGNKYNSLIYDFLLGLIFGICIASYSAAIIIGPALLLIPSKKRFIIFFLSSIFGYWLIELYANYLDSEYVDVFRNSIYFFISEPNKIIIHLSDPNIRNALLSILLPGLIINLKIYFGNTEKIKIKDRIKHFLFLISFIIVIAISLISNKLVSYNPINPFYSVERFYIAIPYLNALFITYVINNYGKTLKNFSTINYKLSKKFVYYFFIAIFIFHLTIFYNFILDNREKYVSMPSSVWLTNKSWLQDNCSNLKNEFSQNTAYYFKWEGRDDALIYGCSAVYDVPIIMTKEDRRTWMRKYFESIGLKEKKILDPNFYSRPWELK